MATPFLEFLQSRPHGQLRNGYRILRKLPRIYRYKDFVKYSFKESPHHIEDLPCLLPNWDNTPRSGINGVVFHESTPELFRIHVQHEFGKVSSKPLEDRLVFVKSWNEWAEGNYLEPDKKFGLSYLKVLANEVFQKSVQETRN